MPCDEMRRRYKRKKILWKPILSLLLLINVAIAAFQSRITSVRVVEVKGLRGEDETRIKGLLEELRGVPFSKVRETEIETEVLREAAIRSADLSHNMWGGGELKVAYRTAVARMGLEGNLGLDSEGVIFESPDLSRDLPAIRIAEGGPATLVAIAGDWDNVHLADLAAKVRAIPLANGVSIDVDRRGEVCLNMNPGRVVLGSCDDLDEKLAALQKRLLVNPAELSQVQSLILTKPDAPAIVPLPKTPNRTRRTG